MTSITVGIEQCLSGKSTRRIKRTRGQDVSPGLSSQDGPSKQLLSRIRDWMEREIDFIDHPLFHESNVASRLKQMRPDSLNKPLPPCKPEPGLAFVAGMVESPLLTLEEEQYLFAHMNHLKRRAECYRRRLSLNHPEESLVEKIECLLQEATDVRNRIVRANLRLVVSIAKKLAVAGSDHTLDQISELVSEGTLPLIRSVELFDVSLGNRFSTYATWAVRNQMGRMLKRRKSQIGSVAQDDDFPIDRFVDGRSIPEDDERQVRQREQLIRQFLSQLDERERVAITARFGLDGQPQGQSLHDVAQQIGVSKERARQIVNATLDKLRGLAEPGELEIEV